MLKRYSSSRQTYLEATERHLPDEITHSCRPTQVNAPRLNPAWRAGARFTYPGRMKDWVDFGVGYISRWFACPSSSSNHLIATRPGVEPTTYPPSLPNPQCRGITHSYLLPGTGEHAMVWIKTWRAQSKPGLSVFDSPTPDSPRDAELSWPGWFSDACHRSRNC